jgi:hypothetical protein
LHFTAEIGLPIPSAALQGMHSGSKFNRGSRFKINTKYGIRNHVQKVQRLLGTVSWLSELSLQSLLLPALRAYTKIGGDFFITLNTQHFTAGLALIFNLRESSYMWVQSPSQMV